jgi:hypothetical protein
LTFYYQGYSLKHNLLNMAFFIPAYAFALSALGFLKRTGAAGQDKGTQKTAVLCLALIVSFALFHAVTNIDFDWRYRLPIIFPLILLAAIGFDAVIKTYFAGLDKVLGSAQHA